MAKKKKSLFSLFFGVMLKVVPFIFDTFFTFIRFIVILFSKFIQFLFKTTKTEIKNQQTNAAQPKSKAFYTSCEVINSVTGSFKLFEQHLYESKSTIGLILGARGSGKSALGMRILENVSAKTNKKIYAMGFLPETLPIWITSVEKIEQISNSSFILIDEGGILFSSRGSMSSANKILSEFLLIARHKDLSILFISQNSANLEINAIRQADYLLLRSSSLLQKDFERKKIKEVYLEAEKNFPDFSVLKNRLTYIYSDLFKGYIQNELPTFWSEKTSTSFKNR